MLSVLKQIKTMAILLIFSSCTKEVNLRLNVWKGFAPKYATSEFIKRMQEKHNIKVNIEVTNPINEDDFHYALVKNKADLISASHYLFRDPTYRYLANDMLLEIDLKKIPNYKKLIMAFTEFDFVRKEKKIYGVPLENSSYRLVYNAKKVKVPPTSWKMLWNKKYKRQYAVSEYYFETNFYVTALASDIPFSKIFDIEYVASNKTFLKNLDSLALNAKNYWSDLEVPKDIEGNHIATAFGNFIHKLSPKEEWKFAHPIEGVPGSMDFMIINRLAKSDPLKVLIAHEWINFTLSEFYQRRVIMRGNGEMPVISKFKTNLKQYETNRYMLSDDKYYKEQRFLWPARTRKNLILMEKVWKNSLKKAKNKNL